jgi:pimeloyl-ACP methyl ester carboxylesterase
MRALVWLGLLAPLLHAAVLAPVQIPTGGVKINGVFYLAAGKQAHPTLIILHGVPGIEQILDVAQAACDAGWNSLTLHYRGSWGSPGTFSYTHMIGDAEAAVAFVRDPDVAARYSIDTRHIVLAGHSGGASAAVVAAANVEGIAGIVLISAVDADGIAAHLKTPQARAALAGRQTPCPPMLTGCTGEGLDLEAADHASSWGFAVLAPHLTKIPLLMFTSDDGYREENDKLAADIVSKGGAEPTRIYWKTDHGYSDRRKDLSDAIVQWLQKMST